MYVSQDDTAFTKFGRITVPSVYGVLSVALPTGLNYPSVDTVNTCSVDLTDSTGAMVSQPSAAFAQLLPLCYVGNEWICYETATLTATYKYGLTHLYRGLYGTPATGSHAIGAPFAVIDFSSTGGTFRLPWPTGQDGQVLYFKFPAFNPYGQSEEDLASVTSYAHTIGVAGAILYDAIAQGTLPVNADGSWSAYIDGPTFVASYTVATSLSAFPSDATAAAGTVYNGRTIEVDSATDLTQGEAIYLTIVPWTGTGGTGNQLPSIHLKGGYELGPQLILTPTPGPTSYSIAWSGDGTITVSINGGSYGTPGTSPIVVTRTTSDQSYAFKSVLNGQTEYETIIVPALGSTLDYPLLHIIPGTSTATVTPVEVTFSDPLGATTPTGTYDLINCTAAGGTIGPGTGFSITSGTTVNVDRPAFSTTAVAAINFHAAIGSATSNGGLTILNQVKTSFGPSITATYTPISNTSGTVAWSASGDSVAVTLSIDGAAPTSVATSGSTGVTLDANTHSYTYAATADGQTVPAIVTVPAAGGGTKSLSIVGGYATNAGATGPPFNELTVTWSDSGFPTGTTFDLQYNNGGSPPSYGTHLAATGTSYSFTSVTFNGGGSVPGTGQLTVTAQFNGQTLATVTKVVTYTY